MKQRSWFAALHPHTDHRWGIILAGGNGARLQHFIKARFGEYRPKQYCALIGKRSMLRHCIDRVSTLFPHDHLLTTVNAQHLSWAYSDLHDRKPGTVVIQPLNRETGPGILLPLLHVHRADPHAVVVLFPADHFILQEERFRSYVNKAIEYSTKHRDRIVALGTIPTAMQYGYGWIEKGEQTRTTEIFSVKKFWEKPDADMTTYLQEKNCLWNTMILVGTSSSFLNVFEEHMPEVFVPMKRIMQSIGTPHQSEVSRDVFQTIPAANFSHSILEKISDQLAVIQMSGVYWNDWGDETRIQTDIDFLLHPEHAGQKEEMQLWREYIR